jgi:dihydrofolate reductase
MPWHLPEDFRWFRAATLTHAVLMGRKTLEAIGRPLPGRLNLVATRGPAIALPGVVTITDLSAFREADYAPREVWVAGGAEIYARMLPHCAELYVSLVAGHYAGDTFFPPFEDDFNLAEILLQRPEFEVRKYRRKDQERY